MRRTPSSWTVILAQLGFRRVARKAKKRGNTPGRRSILESLEDRRMMTVDALDLALTDDWRNTVDVAAATFKAGHFTMTSDDWSGKSTGGRTKADGYALGIDSGNRRNNPTAFDPGESWSTRFNQAGRLTAIHFESFTVEGADGALLYIGDNPPVAIKASQVKDSVWRPQQPLSFGAGETIRLEAAAPTTTDLEEAISARQERLLKQSPVASKLETPWQPTSTWKVRGFHVLGETDSVYGGYVALARSQPTADEASQLLLQSSGNGVDRDYGYASAALVTPDVKITAFRVASDASKLAINYSITDGPVSNFSISVYRSLDGVNPLGDVLHTQPDISGSGPSGSFEFDVQLANEHLYNDDDYYLLAIIDATGEDSSNNNHVFNGGVFQDAGVVYFHGPKSDYADEVAIHKEIVGADSHYELIWNGRWYPAVYDHGGQFSDIVLRTHGGNDTITANDADLNAGRIRAFVGDGNNNVYLGNSEDYVEGETGIDTVYGGAGKDKVLAGGGETYDPGYGQYSGDFLFGQGGDDELHGEAGPDWIDGGADDDLIFGGDEFGDGDYFSDGYGDYLLGGDGDDVLFGGFGGDHLYGGGDNDLLYGQASNDYLYGMAGNDVLIDAVGVLNWGNAIASDHDPIFVTQLVDDNETIESADFRLSNLSLRESLNIAWLQLGNDAIQFAEHVRGVSQLATGELDINSNVVITGPGADQFAVKADGTTSVVIVRPDVVATIEGVKITGGGGVEEGGGIFNSGDLTLNKVEVSGNSSTFTGGGITSNNPAGSGVNSLRIIDSTIRDNHSSIGSGLRVVLYGGVLEITGSTISDNTDVPLENYSEGGGLNLYAAAGSALIQNSTFSGNSAKYVGAIRVQSAAPVSIINSTIAFNTGDGSGGLYNLSQSDKVTLHNSIVAENRTHDATPVSADITGAVNAASSYNIFGAGANGQNFTDLYNQLGTPAGPIDPRLAPLGSYGGLTKTHALRPGSPAINAASSVPGVGAYDQRGEGFARSTGAAIDIGSYESSATADKAYTVIDAAGKLYVGNQISELEEIIIGTTLLGATRLVTINGEITSIRSSDVIAIEILGGNVDERIDLSQVKALAFPNLQNGTLVKAADGNDTIFGSEFADVIYAGGGVDQVHGGLGDDELYGEAGDDVLFGDEGEDTLLGGDHNDAIYGGIGNDELRGSFGNDVLYAGEGYDSAYGDDGDDELYGELGNDALLGGGGNDVLDGGSDNNSVEGGAGDDRYVVGNEVLLTGISTDFRIDEIVDEAGNDTIDLSSWKLYAGNSGAQVSLNDNSFGHVDSSGSIGLPLLNQSGVENVLGTAFDDMLSANGAAGGRLEGGAGNDTLNGGAGDDLLLGGIGRDHLYGNSGSDILYGGDGDDVLHGGEFSASDALYGEQGNDHYHASVATAATVFYEGAGDDQYHFGAGNLGTVTIMPEAPGATGGIDVLDFQSMGAGVGVSLAAVGVQSVVSTGPQLLSLQIADESHAAGAALIENVIGSAFDDSITGDSRDNTLRGGAGFDTLIGGGGSDVLLGESGFDELEVIDQADSSGFQATPSGNWSESDLGTGFNGGQKFAEGAMSATAAAVWNFTGLATGKYEVYVTWQADPADLEAGASTWYGATNANFSVMAAVNGSAVVNQRRSPQGDMVGGVEWQRIGGEFSPTSGGEISVTLSNLANGRVYADAVRVVKHNAAPTIETPIGDQDVLVDGNLDITITAADDGGGGNLSFEFAGNVPAGLTLTQDGVGGANLQWLASAVRPTGQFPVTIVVKDNGAPNKSTSESFLITVGSVPSIPEFGALALDHAINDGNGLSIVLGATGSNLSFSLGPNAPAGAGFDPLQPNRFVWKPSGLQNSPTPYLITLRVTQNGHPPLRLEKTIGVTVNVNDAPTWSADEPLRLLYDSYAPTTIGGDNDGETINPTLTGGVINDGDADDVQVLIDYNSTYHPQTNPTGFQTDVTASVVASDADSSVGTFVVSPTSSQFPLTGNGAMTVAVKLREWDPTIGDNGGFIESDVQLLDIVADVSEDTPPSFNELILRNNTGTIVAPEGVDPTVTGIVANADGGPVAELTVRVYDVDPSVFTTAAPIATLRTDDDGTFSFTPSGLVALDASDAIPNDGRVSVARWFVAEESTPLGVFPSTPKLYEYTFLVNRPPEIAELELLLDTGSSATDGITSIATVVGRIAHADGSLEGIAVEFDHDNDNVVDGMAVTDAAGKFTYVPVTPSLVVGSIDARAVEWDDYQEIPLASRWLDDPLATHLDPLPFVFDAGANEAPRVLSLEPKYPTVGGLLANPTVRGQISNDNGVGNAAIELYAVAYDPNLGFPTSQEAVQPNRIIGLVDADDEGWFEFTPTDFIAGRAYAVFARAIEWDGQPAMSGSSIYESILVDDQWLDSTSITLADVPLAIDSFSGVQLAYDTGALDDDSRTNDPTLVGTIDYDGDYSQLTIEFDHDGNGTVDGTAVPDENGRVRYTPQRLIEGQEATITARVRAPDFGVRPNDFEDGLTSAWYAGGYDDVGVWTDADANGDGLLDIHEAWLNAVFNADETEFEGEWFNSDFQRDWDNLFDDFTTSFSQAAITFTLDAAENQAATASTPVLSMPGPPATAPIIAGAVTDDGHAAGLRVEFYLNGSTDADGYATTDENGEYVYAMDAHIIGANSIIIRVYENVYDDTMPTFTDSGPFAIDIDSSPGLFVKTLSLLHGEQNGLLWEAIDPTLRGTVTAIGSPAALLVQFDYDGDGRPDASTTTDGLGAFEFAPEGLTVDSGSTTVRAQVVEEMDDAAGDLRYKALSEWKSLTWTVLTNAAPMIEQFELLNDTRSMPLEDADPTVRALDRVTTDPTLVGRVSNANGVGMLTVEFDHDDNDTIDGTALTDENGFFRYTPTGLTAKGWNIKALVREYDLVSGLSKDSDEASFGFTLISPRQATIDAVTLSSNPYDPTVTGSVSDLDGTDNLTIEFYQHFFDGGLLQQVKYLGSTKALADGSFDFLPIGLEFTEGGSKIQAEVVEWNYATNAALPKAVLISSAEVAFTPTPANFSVTLDPQSGNAFDLTVSGILSSDPVIAPQYVEIDSDGDGDGDSIVSFTVNDNGGYGYSYEPTVATSNGVLAVNARPVGRNVDGYVFGAWAPVTFSYDFKVPSIAAGWTLTDENTSAPSISGLVNADPAVFGGEAAPPIVEFDTDGDGQVDDTVVTGEDGSDGAFSYTFRNLSPGGQNVQARAVRYETVVEGSGDDAVSRTHTITGAWQAIPLTIVDPAPGVNGLMLVNPTSVAPPEAVDPTIKGQVTSSVASDLSGLTIEIDHDGDKIADGTAITRDDGSFEYTPRNLNIGDVTLNIRAVDPFTESRRLVGAWQPLSFQLIAFQPDVTSLELLLIEGEVGGAPISSSPTFAGTAAREASVSLITIEFDHNGDDRADGTVTADAQGNFTYTPTGLSHGPQTMRARAVARTASGVVAEDWDAHALQFPFFFRSTDPPVISDLVAANVTTAAVSGRLTVGGVGTAGLVEVAVKEGEVHVHNGFATADANGFFTYTPRDLTQGEVELAVRGLINDPSSAVPITGELWQYTGEFSYAPGPAPATPLTIEEFRLAYDTGGGALGSNGITADPTLVGKIDSASPLVTIEFSHNASAPESAPTASVSVAADGSFEYRPAGLVDAAAVTIYVRYRVWNPASGAATYSDWTAVTPVTLTLNAAENAPALVTELAPRSPIALVGGHAITMSPAFVGRVSNDGPLGGLIVRFDHNGDGIFDGSTVTRDDGSFDYRSANLQPGAAPQTITATVAERDYQGGELPAAASLARTFILQAAPQVTLLDYVPTAGTDGTIQGIVQTSAAPVAAHVEYLLFGNYQHAPTPPASLIDFQPNDPVRIASVSSTGSFEIDLATFGLGLGPASVIVRAVDAEGAVGAWETLQFVVEPSTVAALPINNFKLFEDTGAADGQSSNSMVEGVVGSGGAGAFAIVEITVDDDPNTSNEKVFRTVADAAGRFTYTPAGLALGQPYTIVARHIAFDPELGEELEGVPSSLNFTLLNNNVATIVQYGRKNPNSDDPTIKGFVIDDGRLAGIRVEFDVELAAEGNDEVDGFAYTDATGYFEFTPHGLIANEAKIVRARVVEWDGVAEEYVSGEFGTDASVSVTLSQAGPTDPTLDDDFAADQGSVDHADASALDGVISYLGAITGASGGAVNSIDVGIGSVQLVHRGGADSLDGGDGFNDNAFTFDGDQMPVSEAVTLAGAIDANFLTADGADLDGSYSYTKTVTVTNNDIHVFVSYSLSFSNYHRRDDFADTIGASDAARWVLLGMSGTYTFTYEANAVNTGSGTVEIVGAHTITETLEYDYWRKETTRHSAGAEGGAGPQQYSFTTSGDYFYGYTEDDSSFGGGEVAQAFDYHEEVHLESWLENSGGSSSSAGGGRSSHSFSESEHSLYNEIIDNVGVITVVNGVQTAVGTITIDAGGSLTTSRTETSTYQNSFSSSGGASESGGLTRSQSSQFAGEYHGTDNYVAGQSSDTTFTYSEASNTTGAEAGYGSASSASTNQQYSENWDYSVKASLSSNLNASGASQRDLSAPGGHNTFSVSVDQTATTSRNGRSSGSVIHTAGGDTTRVQGNASLTGSASMTENSAIAGNDDDVFIASQGSLTYTGTYKESVTASGDSSSATHSETWASRRAIDAGGGGSSTYEGTSSGVNVSVTGSFGSSSEVTRLTASQVAGWQLVPDGEGGTEKVPYRSNTATRATAGSEGDGVYSYEQREQGGALLVDRQTIGFAARTLTGEGKSSSYSGIGGKYDGYTLTKSAGSSLDAVAGDYIDANGVVDVSGTYFKHSEGSSDTLSVISGRDEFVGPSSTTITTFESRVSAGSESDETSQGVYHDGPAGRSTTGVGSFTNKAFGQSSGSSTTLTTAVDSFSMSSGSSSAKSKLTVAGHGVAQTEDGALTASAGVTTSDASARSASSGAYAAVSVEVDGPTTTTRAEGSSSFGRSEDATSATETYRGADSDRTSATEVDGSYSGTSGGGAFTSEMVVYQLGNETRSTTTTHHGGSRASSSGSGSGVVTRNDGREGYEYQVQSASSGGYSGGSSITVAVSTDAFSRSERSAATNSGSGDSSFSGTLSYRGDKFSRAGQASRSGEVASGVEATIIENSKSAGGALSWTVSKAGLEASKESSFDGDVKEDNTGSLLSGRASETDTVASGGSETKGTRTPQAAGVVGYSQSVVTDGERASLSKTLSGDVTVNNGVATVANPSVTETARDHVFQAVGTESRLRSGENVTRYDKRTLHSQTITETSTDGGEPTRTDARAFEEAFESYEKAVSGNAGEETIIVTTVDREQDDATTYRQGSGGRESLTTSNHLEEKTVKTTDDSSAGSYQTEITRRDATGSYTSSHQVDSSGRVSGGRLSASSSDATRYRSRTDRQETSSIGPYELGNVGQTQETWRDDSSSLTTKTSSERGSYYDSAGRRVQQGSYQESETHRSGFQNDFHRRISGEADGVEVIEEYESKYAETSRSGWRAQGSYGPDGGTRRSGEWSAGSSTDEVWDSKQRTDDDPNGEDYWYWTREKTVEASRRPEAGTPTSTRDTIFLADGYSSNDTRHILYGGDLLGNAPIEINPPVEDLYNGNPPEGNTPYEYESGGGDGGVNPFDPGRATIEQSALDDPLWQVVDTQENAPEPELQWWEDSGWDWVNLGALPGVRNLINLFTGYSDSVDRGKELARQQVADDPDRVLRAGDIGTISGGTQFRDSAKAGSQAKQVIRDTAANIALEASTAGMGGFLSKADDVNDLRKAGKFGGTVKTAVKAVPTVKHHTIPIAILNALPANVANDPRIRGLRGAPNRWSIPEDLHKDIHRGAQGGPYNKFFKDKLADNPEPTVEDVLGWREEAIKKFGLEEFRP
jgi:Ca2+-binding RTX toxin-like protein